MMTELPSSTPLMTHLDAKRLESLLSSRVGLAYRMEAGRLRDKLRRAAVIAAHAAPSDLVTMNSTVRFEVEGDGSPRTVTLVYPWRAGERDVVSVLSPLGTTLLGLRVGSHATLDGDGRTLRVLGVSYQPEAFGHWHL